MKRLLFLLPVVFLSSIAKDLCADGKKITYFGQAEYLTYSDAFNKNQDKFNEWVKGASEDIEPYESVTSNSKTAGGAGARIGVFSGTPVKGLQIGGSLGYIMGPKFEGKAHLNSFFLDAYGDITDPYTIDHTVKNESNIWRLMAESKYSIPIGKKFQARLGFGIGIATLHVEENILDELVGGATLLSEKKAINTTKITWEIGPAIAYVTEKNGVELALTYSQVPSAQDMNTFQKFDWNPFGIRLGVEF